METFVGIEWSHAYSGVMCAVVGMLGQGEEVCPVGLQVVAKGAEVLLDRLVDAFGLAVGFRMKGGR
jgi:hypothetical protein